MSGNVYQSCWCLMFLLFQMENFLSSSLFQVFRCIYTLISAWCCFISIQHSANNHNSSSVLSREASEIKWNCLPDNNMILFH